MAQNIAHTLGPTSCYFSSKILSSTCTNFGCSHFILCKCSFDEPCCHRFGKRKANVACGGCPIPWFGICVHLSLEFFSCQIPSSQDSTGVCSGGLLGVATLLKAALQKMYHWMIHCSCILLSCLSLVAQLSTCLLCAFPMPFAFPRLCWI